MTWRENETDTVRWITQKCSTTGRRPQNTTSAFGAKVIFIVDQRSIHLHQRFATVCIQIVRDDETARIFAALADHDVDVF